MYYRINSRRVSYREFRTGHNPLVAGLNWLVLRLPVHIPGSSDYPAVDDLAPFISRKAGIPPAIVARFEPLHRELAQLGFQGTLFHHVLDPVQHNETYFASFVHRSNVTVARAQYRRAEATAPIREFSHVEFITALKDGVFVVTSNSGGDLSTNGKVRMEYRKRAPLDELWNRHRERLEAPDVRGQMERFADPKALLESVHRYHATAAQALVARKVFVPVSDPAVLVAAAPVAGAQRSATMAPTSGQGHEALLTEIRRLELSPPRSYVSSLVILAASLILFVAAGGAVWSWKLVLMLVPILLFHEAGHYLAMKLFDYQNVQMFFIPFFGAAVSGRHYDVPGWKRIVTSLMGPVPGIFVGIGLGIVGIVQHNDLLLELALTALIINGFNLVPALPFDGGWVLHGLIFCRHAFLDVLFRLFAAGAVIFGSFVGLGLFMRYLGIGMLVQLPMAFRVARITDRLRGKDTIERVTEDGHLPTRTAVAIANELDRDLPKGVDIASKAKLVVKIYENINARAPGVLATMFLTLVYLVSGVAAIVGAGVFVVARNSNVSQLLDDLAQGPQTPLVVGEMKWLPEQVEIESFRTEHCLVLTCSDRETAERIVAELRPTITAETPVLLAGNSVLIAAGGEGAHEKLIAWAERYQAQAPDSFITRPDYRASLTLTCIVDSAAIGERLVAEFRGYNFNNETLRLIPPWQPDLPLTPDQQRARQTVSRILRLGAPQEGEEDGADSKLQELWQRAEEANRKGRQAEWKKYQAEIRDYQIERYRSLLAGLEQLPDNEIDRAILTRYVQTWQERIAQASTTEPADEAASSFGLYAAALDQEVSVWLGDLAERLGQRGEGESDAGTCSTSYAHANGPLVTIYVAPDFPAACLQMILPWLARQGGSDFKYRIGSVGGID